MNLKHILKMLVVLLLCSGLALSVACGDDETSENQNQETNQDEDVGVMDADDNQNQDEPDADEPEPDADDPDPDADDPDADDPDANQQPGEPHVELADPTPTCDDTPKPDRCDVSTDDFDDWGPASLVDTLALDEDCCVDYTGDGNVDNALASIINFQDGLDDANAGIQASIDSGDLLIVFEHDGLDAIEAGQEYDINFFLGLEANEDGVALDPLSFDDGSYPLAMLPDATTSQNGEYDLETQPGTVQLSLNIGALTGDPDAEEEIDLVISNATITGTMVASSSSVEGGVVIDNGELGGLVLRQSLADAINTFAETCDCLDGETLLEINDDDDMECVLSLEPDEISNDDGTGVCDESGEEMCGTVGGFCGVLELADTLFADVDTTGDNTNDAFSIGLSFTADATVILGVGEDALDNGDNGDNGGNGGNGD